MEYLTHQDIPAHLNPLQIRTMRHSHNQPTERPSSVASLAPVRTSISSHLSILPPPSAISRRPPPCICNPLQIYHDIPSIGSPDDPLVHIPPTIRLKRRFSRVLEDPSRHQGQSSQARDQQPSQDLEIRQQPLHTTTTTERAASNISQQGHIIRDSPPLQPGEQASTVRLPSFNEVCPFSTPPCNPKI